MKRSQPSKEKKRKELMYFAILFLVLRVEIALVAIWATVDEVPSFLVSNTSSVVAGAEVQVVPSDSIEGAVRSPAPVHVVVPRAADGSIRSVIAIHLVVSGVSTGVVGPLASQQDVMPALPAENVLTSAPADRVVAATTKNHVAAVGPPDGVVSGSAPLRWLFGQTRGSRWGCGRNE
jgi:hypothetical protein